MLYLGLGDGGSGGDPMGNGQNLGTLLGAVLRLDVREASEAAPYRVPSDNPFVGVAGARPEIWAYGLRNPWRMAFDATSGELWVGDVGQSSVEEVDIVVGGGNYGWNRLEGNDCFRPRSGCDRSGTVAPVASYGHGEGCSISGGVVYRGAAVPELAGAYVYGDFCSGRVWALDAASRGPAVRVADSGASIASFAQIGEQLWLLRFGGSVLRAVSP
jgi:glucose/arabinose dehydrogenase